MAIIYEVNKELLQQVRSLAKDIAIASLSYPRQTRYCEFENDKRDRYIYVYEMTFEEETKDFLKTNKAFSDNEEVYDKIYENTGGNSTYLSDLLEDHKTYPLDVCIERLLINFCPGRFESVSTPAYFDGSQGAPRRSSGGRFCKSIL